MHSEIQSLKFFLFDGCCYSSGFNHNRVYCWIIVSVNCGLWSMYWCVDWCLKGFFRRCIIQGLTQQCANSEKCEITPLTRNSCQFCRLKKCFAVGMSRGGQLIERSATNSTIFMLIFNFIVIVVCLHSNWILSKS